MLVHPYINSLFSLFFLPHIQFMVYNIFYTRLSRAPDCFFLLRV